jgi:hypothetical protein
VWRKKADAYPADWFLNLQILTSGLPMSGGILYVISGFVYFFVWVDLLAPGTATFLAGRGVAFFALMNRPVFASRPTLIDVAFARLFTMFSPHRLAQLFPCRELGSFARRQGEGLTGPGIAPGPSASCHRRKGAKAH